MLPRPDLETESYVFEHGHVAEQRVVLKDESHAALARGAGR